MIRITLALRINASTPQPPPPSFFLFASPSPSSSSSQRRSSAMAQSRSIRIAVVGDVHDDWDLEEDSRALHFLQPDLVLFTGDYGNENVELVRSISTLDIPKSVILGNHDSWRTHQFSELKKKADRVQLQLECLGEQHVGYKRVDFPNLHVSVVGGRPFSCGGEALFRPRLLSARYGVNDMEESAKKIYEAALGTPEGHSIVLLAHNGPTGLGSKVDDICGRDWVYGGGDHGDPVLTMHKCDRIKCTLPSDIIIYDILPRVPSEMLLSWRFACKQWFQVMYNDPMFIDAQLAKSKRKFIFDIDVKDYFHKQMEVDIVFNEITRTITSFTFSSISANKFDGIKDEMGSNIVIDISVKFSINSCNGLILLQHLKNEFLFYIVNPATKQCVSLPQSNFPISCSGLGYDPFSKKYKVVHFFRKFNKQMNNMCDGCVVLTLGTNTWRPIELPFEYFNDLDRPISVGTYLHFRYKDWDGPSKLKLKSHGGKPRFYNIIASMDIVNETCRLTSPPDEISGPFNLLTMGESLALAPCDSVCDRIDIWILDDCVKGLWSKKYSIAKDLCSGHGLPDFLRPIATLDNGKVVIFQELNELRLFYFVVGCNKFREIQSPWKIPDSWDPHRRYPAVIKVFDHISTLASPYAQ